MYQNTKLCIPKILFDQKNVSLSQLTIIIQEETKLNDL